MFAKTDSNKMYNLIFSWIIVSALFFTNRQMNLISLPVYKILAFVIFVDAVLLIWLLINRIRDQRYVKIAMILFSTIYFTAAAVIDTQQLLAMGLCVVLGIIILSTDVRDIRFVAGEKGFRNTILFLSFLFVVLVGGNCCLIFLNHIAPCFDFGLFSQMFHYMKETGIPFTTCERDKLLSHFAVHVSPVYYLMFPFYYLFPSPMTLELLQSIIAVSGIIPLILIMKRHSLGRGVMIFFALIYIFFPGFAGGCFWHLHENCFLAPFVLWLIYFCEKELWYGQVIFAVLTLAVKEDAAVYVAAISLYFLLTRKSRKCNYCILAASVLYFIGVTYYLTVYGDGIQMGRYDNFVINGEGPLTLLSAVITDPVNIIRQLMVADKLKFIFMTLMPMGFLPLITKDYRRAILMLPWLLINLLASLSYQYNMTFHYCFGTCAILIYLAVINYTDLTKNYRKKMLLYGACCTVILFASVNHSCLGYIDTYKNDAESRARINYAISLIPEDASVAAGTYLVADLADHDELYELEKTKNKADYYILDLRRKNEKYDIKDFLNEKYETIYYEPGAAAVFKRIR